MIVVRLFLPLLIASPGQTLADCSLIASQSAAAVFASSRHALPPSSRVGGESDAGGSSFWDLHPKLILRHAGPDVGTTGERKA